MDLISGSMILETVPGKLCEKYHNAGAGTGGLLRPACKGKRDGTFRRRKGKDRSGGRGVLCLAHGGGDCYMGVSESDIKEYYEHYALAQKVYHSLTKAVNEEVSDDEARVMEIMQIFVSDESRANEIASRLAQGEDFATLANNYNELGSIQVNISRDDLPAAVEEIAFQMENDEVSGKITVDGAFISLNA